MDPTVLSSLIGVGGMVFGFLIRHYLGSSTSGSQVAASAVPSAAVQSSAPPSQQIAAPGNAATHPLLAALMAQFDAAIQQIAVNFANSTLTVPKTTASAPATPTK